MAIKIEKQKNGLYRVRVWAISRDIYGIRKTRQKSNIHTMAVAKMIALEFEEEVNNDKKSNSDLTFSNLERKYFEIKDNKIQPTTKANLQNISEKLNNEFGRIKIKDITNFVAQKGFDNLSNLENPHKPGQKIKKGTVVRMFRHFQAVMNFGVDYDFLEFNKVHKISFREDEDDFIPTVLSAEQVHDVLKFTKQNFYSIYIPVLLSVTTSLRRGEALGLKWESVDFENNLIHIQNNIVVAGNKVIEKTKMKTKTSKRVLPMSDLVRSELEEHFKMNQELNNDYVCANIFTGEIPSPTYLTKSFAKMMQEEFGIQMRLHDLRHTFSQLTFENGVDNTIRSQILGHSNENITNRVYTQTSVQKMQKAMEIVSEKIKESN